MSDDKTRDSLLSALRARSRQHAALGETEKRDALVRALLARERKADTDVDLLRNVSPSALAEALVVKPEPSPPQLTVEQRKGLLSNYRTQLLIEHRFVPGDFVRWKTGLKNRKWPQYDEPAIVLEVMDEWLISEEDDSGSPYFREPLSIVLGVLDEDGELTSYYFDKRRFEPMP